MRLRDTRMFCAFVNEDDATPTVLRENCWREATFQSLSLVSGHHPARMIGFQSTHLHSL